MAKTSGSVMLRAATHLNDPSQLVWTSGVMLPFLNMALGELDDELAVHGVSPLRNESIIATVDIADTTIAMPVGFVEAVSLSERIRGSSDFWREVDEVRWIDRNLTTQTEIVQWATRGQSAIEINAPQSDREVLLRYIAGITEATGTGTTLDYDASANYLGLLTAKNAARDGGNSSSKVSMLEPDITRARDRMLRRLVKGKQSIGVRRRPYSGR